MKNLDLTLAICMYNAEQYIEETLQSVLLQTMQNFHLLIVNDCSTDNSVVVVERFFQENPRRYELISFKENRGIGYARHFAERHAQTTYMMFLDADDILYPQAITRMYETIIADSDLMAVGCHLEYVNEKGVGIGGGLFLGETTKSGFYEKAAQKKLIFMQPTAIYNREIALSVGGYVIDGYPEGRPRYQDYCEDLDLWTRMSDLYSDGKAIIVVPEILCKYRKVGSGLSASSFNMIIKMRYTKVNLKRRRRGESELSFIDFKAQISDKEYTRLEREARAADYLRQGYYLLKRGRVFSGISCLIKSIWNNPSYIVDKVKHNILRKNSNVYR